MFNIIRYFVSNSKNEMEVDLEKQDSSTTRTFEMVKANKNIVYLVMDKNTNTPLGVFDNLELAKRNGQKVSYYNCIIIPFKLNDSCKYLFSSVFEN